MADIRALEQLYEKLKNQDELFEKKINDSQKETHFEINKDYVNLKIDAEDDINLNSEKTLNEGLEQSQFKELQVRKYERNPRVEALHNFIKLQLSDTKQKLQNEENEENSQTASQISNQIEKNDEQVEYKSDQYKNEIVEQKERAELQQSSQINFKSSDFDYINDEQFVISQTVKKQSNFTDDINILLDLKQRENLQLNQQNDELDVQPVINKIDDAVNKIMSQIKNLSFKSDEINKEWMKNQEDFQDILKNDEFSSQNLQEQAINGQQQENTKKSTNQHNNSYFNKYNYESEQRLQIKNQQNKNKLLNQTEMLSKNQKSHNKRDSFVQKVQLQQQMKQEKLDQLTKELQENDQIRMLQNTVKISKKSEKILQKKQNYIPIQERSQNIIAQKLQKYQQIKQEEQEKKDQKELIQCTFKPITNNNQELYKRTKEEFIIQHQEWHKKNQLKLINLKLEQEIQQTHQCTYTPQINLNNSSITSFATSQNNNNISKTKQKENQNKSDVSQRLYNNYSEIQQKKQKLADQEQQKHSFHPIITPKSIEIAIKKKLKDTINQNEELFI